MSTAPTSRPDDTAGPPAGTALTGEAPWPRRLLSGLVAGALAWGVAALLGPEQETWRQLTAAAFTAVAVVAVPYILGLGPRPPTPGMAEHTRQVESALAEHTAAVREGLIRHDDALRSGLTRHTEDVRHLVEDRLPAPDAEPAPEPGPRPQLDRIRVDSVPDLARNFAELLAPGPSILHTFVHLEMARVVGHMADLSSLSAECPGENHDWMLTLTRAADQSICATSTSVDREFWSSEPAGRYLDGQQEAIDDRGVAVRRLFLLESARELDDRLLRLCEEQELRRIDVRVAVLPELPPHLQRGTTNDFIVYDEEVSFEVEQDLRAVNVSTRLIARHDHVRDRMKRFKELWDAGMGLRELEVRVDAEEDGNWMVDQA
ncbi:hypothetical protein [Streptomyces sp. NPDC003717]|uniref:hypothetical protein n=1 Tax=Streptomyces sp. NPDC003717 TaxID=3154276 RepID=UPI0033B1DB83